MDHPFRDFSVSFDHLLIDGVRIDKPDYVTIDDWENFFNKEKAFNEMSAEVDEYVKEIDRLEDQIRELEHDVDELEGEVSTLETDLGTAEGEIERLERQLTGDE